MPSYENQVWRGVLATQTDLEGRVLFSAPWRFNRPLMCGFELYKMVGHTCVLSAGGHGKGKAFVPSQN